MTNLTTTRAFHWLPNTVTIIRMFAGLLLFAVIFNDHRITGIRIACFTAIALTDWVDGWLARKINAYTPWGQLLDPIADKVVLLLAFGYFCSIAQISVWFTLLYFVREIMQTIIRVLYFVRNKMTQTPTLTISKLKTALSYLYGILLFTEQANAILPGPLHIFFEVTIIALSYTGLIKPFLKK